MKKIILSALTICLFSSCDFIRGFKKGLEMGIATVGHIDRVMNGFGEETNAYLTNFESDTIILDEAMYNYSYTQWNTKKEKTINPSLYITFVKHGTLMLDIMGFNQECLIHVDPVSMFGTDYTKMPKADMILVTHEHGDHLDTAAISAVTKESTIFYSNNRVAEITGKSKGLTAGEAVDNDMLRIIPVLAYNTSEGRTQFHPKGRDLGYILEIDRNTVGKTVHNKNNSLRVYIAGDTEPIEEMKELGDIDIAFLPVNQPYTMTPEQAIEAIETIKPKIVYPYHYGQTDLTAIVEHFKDNTDIEVRIRQLQ